MVDIFTDGPNRAINEIGDATAQICQTGRSSAVQHIRRLENNADSLLALASINRSGYSFGDDRTSDPFGKGVAQVVVVIRTSRDNTLEGGAAVL